MDLLDVRLAGRVPATELLEETPNEQRQRPSMKVLSAIDRAILSELTEDPFASNAEIAKNLDVSLKVVAGRIRALDRGKVSRILAVLDLGHMNQSFCFLHIQVRDRQVTDVAEEISRRRLSLMVSEFADGSSDLLVLVRYSDTDSLRAILYDDIAKIEGVVHWRVDMVVSVPIFRPEYVSYNIHYDPPNIEQNISYLKKDLPEGYCDDTDIHIIAHLHVNAHQSINSVARKVGIKPSTARYRINNLKSSEILRFIRVIDQRVSGIDTFTLVEFGIDLRKITQIVAALRDKEWLPQLFVCAGNSALVGILLTANADEVIKIRREELLTIPGIHTVTLSHLLKTHKTDQRWTQKSSNAESP